MIAFRLSETQTAPINYYIVEANLSDRVFNNGTCKKIINDVNILIWHIFRLHQPCCQAQPHESVIVVVKSNSCFVWQSCCHFSAVRQFSNIAKGMVFLWPNGGNKADWGSIQAKQIKSKKYFCHSQLLSYPIIIISNYCHFQLLPFPNPKLSISFPPLLAPVPATAKDQDNLPVVINM